MFYHSLTLKKGMFRPYLRVNEHIYKLIQLSVSSSIRSFTLQSVKPLNLRLNKELAGWIRHPSNEENWFEKLSLAERI